MLVLLLLLFAARLLQPWQELVPLVVPAAAELGECLMLQQNLLMLWVLPELQLQETLLIAQLQQVRQQMMPQCLDLWLIAQ